MSPSAGSSLRIVDFSTHLSGPIASHLLAEMGATVIKVENPRTGDGNRGEFEVVDGIGLMHLALNSGTRSIAVDRRSEAWPKLIDACARWADAVVIGTRPSDAGRRGMDYETMRAANPKIVYCAISGFGEAGPWADRTAHGQTIDSHAGLVPVVEGEVQPQTRGGRRTSGTTLGGVFAALGILGAVHRRDHGFERSQYVSVSLWHAALWWSWRDLTMLANADEEWVDYSDLGSRYSLYETADSRTLLLAPVERKFWERFCELAGLPAELRGRGEWGLSGMEFGKGPEFDDERAAIAGIIATRALDDWVAELEAADVPFAPVLTVAEALRSEHAAANGTMRRTELGGHSLEIPASPIRSALGDEGLVDPADLSPPPEIGEQSAEILAELGVPELADSLRAP